MGISYEVTCKKCHKSYSISLAGTFGGLNYYQSYICPGCDHIFELICERDDFTENITCPRCGDLSADRVTGFPWTNYGEKTTIKCPNCKCKMIFDSEIYFDNE